MVIAKRILLFFATNLLVIISLNILITLITSFFGLSLNPSSYSGLLLMSAIMGTGGAFISLFLSKFMAKNMMGVKIIDPQAANSQERGLVNLVHDLSKKAGLNEMPEVGIYASPDINAFATGPSRNNSLVAVSTGLMNRMNHDEIEGVLGHEVAHIANGDMVTLTLIQGIVNTFTIFLARLISGIISQQVESRNRFMVRWMTTMLFEILFTILGSIVVSYFSRQREYRADAGSAKITGKDKMISALRRLQAVYGTPTQSEDDDSTSANNGLNAFKISSRSRSGLLELFSTHPPLEQRILKLQESRYN